MQLRAIIARNVASFRKTMRWSQADLAARLRVNKQTIWRIESGETNIGADTLEALADAFRIDPCRLLMDPETDMDVESRQRFARLDEVSHCLLRAVETINEFRRVSSL